MREKNIVVAASSNGHIERRTAEGKEYLVLPVVAMVGDSVVRAMNAKSFELVPTAELKAEGWDGKPIFVGHPVIAGSPVSGRHPKVAHTAVGTIRGTQVKDGKLCMEAWLPIDGADEDLLEELESGRNCDVSVGAFVQMEDASGTMNGSSYSGIWRDLEADHLALLPGARGACNWQMGCGVRAAMLAGTEKELKAAWPDKAGFDDHGRGGSAHESAAMAHDKAAASHETAAARHEDAQATGGNFRSERAQQGSKTAEEHSTHALNASRGLTGESYHEDAHASANEALGASHAAAHKSAAQSHRQAANRHRDAARNHREEADKLARFVEENMELHCYAEWLEPGEETDALLKTLRDISKETRDKMPEEDFAGPNRSFPIQEAADVSAASHALGRAKGNRNAIKKKIISIAYRKGFEGSLPDDWKRKSDQKAAAGFVEMMKSAWGFFRGAQPADEMGDSALRQKLYNALMEVEPGVMMVDDYYPVTDPAHVVYCCYDDSGICRYERAFTLSDSGVVTLGSARVEVEMVTTYEPVEGAQPRALKAACGCQSGKGEVAMEKNARIKALITASNGLFTDADLKMLEGASDEQLTQFEARVKTIKDAADKAAADLAAEKAKTPVTPKTASFEEVLATAPADVQASIKAAQDGIKTRREAAIKTLSESKKSPFSAERMATMAVEELESLVVAMGLKAAGAVDHSLAMPPAAGSEVGGQQLVAAASNEKFNEKVAARYKK